MALSICCATAWPSRAAVALASLRELADEVVVAVDVSGGERDVTPLGDVADRVYEIELGTFVESGLAWLHARCAGEWVMRIDDDEVVGESLLEALPELVRARDVVQYWLARRWVYPDAGHWLEQWPWFPDFQGRLVRNDARLWFPGLCHSNVALALPARYLDSGLYHLAHVLSDREERERKIAGYLRVDPALREIGADPYLASYYIPERHPDARVADVDPRDRGAVEALMGRDETLTGRDEEESPRYEEGSPRPVVQSPRAQRVARAEVQASWAARELDEEAYRASIHPVDVHRRLLAGDHRPFRVRAHNEGTERWPGGEERRPLIRVAYRWLTTAGEVVEPEGIRTALPHPLAPGESCLVAMHVTAPATAGRYVLAPDLVHEHVRWFGCESQPVEMRVTEPEDLLMCSPTHAPAPAQTPAEAQVSARAHAPVAVQAQTSAAAQTPVAAQAQASAAAQTPVAAQAQALAAAQTPAKTQATQAPAGGAR